MRHSTAYSQRLAVFFGGAILIFAFTSRVQAANYNIFNCADLQNIGTSLGTCRDNFTLMNDIDWSKCSELSMEFKPVCPALVNPFTGIFDGNKHLISNLVFSDPTNSAFAVGLLRK